MNYKLQDLIDMQHFQSLQDRLNEISSFPSAIIDNEGHVLTATAWQDICTKFHRVNEECRVECIKSDQYILSHLHEANPAVSYRCPHGLIDNATPIVIEGVHYGNFFTGQFFLEKPDLAFFRAQAKKYGFDEAAYLEAVKKVPVWTQQQLDSYLFFIQGLIEVISGIGLKNLREIEVKRQLKESEERLVTILDNVGAAIFIKDAQYRYTYVNQMVCEIFGKTAAEILGRSDEAFFSPASVEEILRSDRPVLERGETVKREEVGLTSADGMPHTYWTVKLPLRSDSGAVYALCGISTEITERKQAEEKIKQSEQFVRNILDTVDEGFLVIDRDYRIVTVNEAYCGQVALPGGEVIGKHCYEVSHKSQRPCFLDGEDCAARRVFETGAPSASTHKHRDAQGDIVFVETKCFPIRDAAGAVTSVIETVNNITERHLLEDERLKTQKLESIGTLAGGIAHDFNNLLQGVFGYIAMAKLSLDQREKSRAMLEQAEKALHQSVNLTTQLLTFSKGGKPVRKRMSLLPVLANSVKFALSGSRSEYRIASDPGLWPVDADEGQIGQVIQNIVLNADQAMPLGGSIVITVRNLPAADGALPHSLKKRDYVAISVRDTGIGMPVDLLTRIFDPYFTTKEKGSGLGLATSYSIVRNHNGLIDVKSEPGKGSAFVVYLPAAAIGGEAPRKESATAGTRAGKILIMDDEEHVRNVAGELLTALGHTPVFADRGEAALEAYRSALESGKPFDIVILDLTVRGGMGGDEALGKLLEIDPAVRAVASSGYSDATLATYQKHGFKTFLKKPYGIEELQRTVAVLLA